MEYILIPYRDESPVHSQGSCWWKWRDRVLVKGPCGHAAALDHEIDDNGLVSPSVQCPIDGCFHGYLQLGDWREHL